MKIKYKPILVLITLAFIAGCNPNNGELPAPTSIPLNDPQSGSDFQDQNIIQPEHPIYLPEGFGITIYASNLEGPRMMAFGPDQHLYVTEPSTGKVVKLADEDQDGLADNVELAADRLVEPSGLAFYEDGSLYVAETTRVLRLTDPDGDGYFQERESIAAGFPAGGNTNRTIIFSQDWKHFYLAIGSSCNVCEEQDNRRASVMRFNADGSEGRIFSQGLRYVIGLAWRTDQEILWAAVIEREGMDDGLPPDNLYAIYTDANAGWPYCYGGRIIDPDLGGKDSCNEKLLKPIYELESQSAPYGMEFYTGDQFPEEYTNDLFIALHGSGSGDNASGYKIVRIQRGTGERNPVEDFAVGWLLEDGTPWGNPTDIVMGPNGDLFLSDENKGVIYRIFYSE